MWIRQSLIYSEDVNVTTCSGLKIQCQVKALARLGRSHLDKQIDIALIIKITTSHRPEKHCESHIGFSSE